MYKTDIIYSQSHTNRFHSLIYCSLARNLNKERPLFQIDHKNKSLHIVSQYPPDINNMKAYIDIENINIDYYMDKMQNIKDGQRFRFVIDTLPQISHNGQRYTLLKPELQKNWFINKANQYGFFFYSLKQEPITRRGKYGVILDGCSFSGCLIVTDYQKFTNALLHGIGHGKAWGFGLLRILSV